MTYDKVTKGHTFTFLICLVLALSILTARGIPLSLQAAQNQNGSGATPVVPPECPGGPSAWSSQPIIDVRWAVTNDEDSAVGGGYWALDNYQRGLIIWQSAAQPLPDVPSDFCAMSQYSGTWQTFAGVPSPQNGVKQPSDGNGRFTGGKVATFTATFMSHTNKPTHGFIGSFDYGGTKSDIQAGGTGGNPVNWPAFYFVDPPGINTAYNEPTWGWVYTQGDGIGYGNMWANYESGNFGDIVTSAACQEGDGNGDFQGNHGNGHVAMDSDGCKDGDVDQVQMSDRGDGHSFQSTSINSASFDPLTNTLTITGVGTSNGLPMAFTFIATETGTTTPGWVSFVSSDGFANAGPLTSGTILLH
jgi:hypothetical protein